MKFHLLRKILSTSLLCALLLPMAACNPTTPSEGAATKDDLTAETVLSDSTIEELSQQERWLSHEMSFISDKIYDDPLFEAQLDVVFTHAETGESFTMPAFWDGGTTWRVRYALTELGQWSWTTVCSDQANAGLHGQTGGMVCVGYAGELDIYKHGFVKTEPGVRYFTYDDGTPFFYLGDTHFTLPLESIDGINPEGLPEHISISQETADEYGITSMFKHIMDYRAEQGFTVIQSQQLGIYVGVSGNSWMGDAEGTIFTHGVNDMILSKFQELDRYFAYIAEKGLVHAHTQFSYPEELIEIYLAGGIDKATIDTLCRYWVARYAAYPVMWTTAQEADPSYGGYNGCTPESNPWPIVMESIAKYDPYNHPSSCHMQNSRGTPFDEFIFDDLPEHAWYAAQIPIYAPSGHQLDFGMMEELWIRSEAKPVVNYEGQYDHFWGGTSKGRMQGWFAYLNGEFGHGYGSQPIWSLFWAGSDPNATYSDEWGEFPTGLSWVEGLYSEASAQLSYMKSFLERYEWWKLTPCFSSPPQNPDGYFTRIDANPSYTVAHDGNRLYIGYFYGTTKETFCGTFWQMENADYEIVWMNCTTGEYTEPVIVTITNGKYKIPKKPTADDWVIAVRLMRE